MDDEQEAPQGYCGYWIIDDDVVQYNLKLLVPWPCHGLRAFFMLTRLVLKLSIAGIAEIVMYEKKDLHKRT